MEEVLQRLVIRLHLEPELADDLLGHIDPFSGVDLGPVTVIVPKRWWYGVQEVIGQRPKVQITPAPSSWPLRALYVQHKSGRQYYNPDFFPPTVSPALEFPANPDLLA